MPDSKLSGLGTATTPTGAESLYLVQGGVDKAGTVAQLGSGISPFSSSAKGVAPASGGGTTNFLRADGTWAAPPASAPGGSSGQIQYNNAGAFGGMTPDQVSSFISDISTYNAQVGTAYTLQASDKGKIVTLNNAAAVSLTCPAGLGAGFSCMIVQLGAGQVGVVAGGGATLGSLSGLTHLSGQNAMGTIISPTASGFILGGQLS